MGRLEAGRVGRIGVWVAAWLLALAVAGCGDRPGPDAGDAADPAAAAAARPLPLIPVPADIARGQGEFVVDAGMPLVAAADDPAAREAAARFADLVQASFGHAPTVVDAAQGRAAIVFATDPDAASRAEGYALEVAPDGIRVRAGDAAGLFYGGVTLWQLLSGDARHALPVTLPALRIEDAPRFAWRGFMLDSARHMQSVDQIKRLLDQMARHKLNVFHWHLTDDQGWRLEIKRYPKLTEVGAWRTPAGKAGQVLRQAQERGKRLRYGGFYTQAQAREIVEHAAKLHITVVPEIELPGHAQAAIAAYPQFGVTGQAPSVSADWGVHTYLYNVDDATFAFLENVLSEVMAIFPGRYIHIGGDEADKYQWRNARQVQAKRRALGLKDDMALQSWFVTRIEKFLVANGRRLIGWDEILEGGLPPEATVMSWRGMKGAVEAARQGHDVVLSPSDVTYLNRMQSEEADEPPGHDFPTPLKAVYGFEPVPPELTAAQSKHVLGAQANLWTEHVRTEPRVEHMAFPRLSALAEVAWSPKDARDFDGFLQRLAPQMRRFEKAGIAAADSAFAARFEVQAKSADAATVALTNQTGFGEIRYTTDGSVPTAQSPRYTAPLSVPLPTTLRATAFHGDAALAKPRTQLVDARALRTRLAEQLPPCNEKGLVLRLEDDEPLDGERAVVPVDIGRPCWLWQQAALDGIAALRAEIVDLPYNFQFGGESAAAPAAVASDAPVALQVFENDCAGKPVASAALSPQDAAIETVEVALPTMTGTHDLCLKFDGDHRRVLWAIDRADLLPAREAR